MSDLLDMTRLERGNLKLNRHPVDLREIVDWAIQAAQADATGGRLTLTADVGNEACVIDADAGRILQVVSNLLRNAIKFTPVGGGVRVSCRGAEGVCNVEVADSGEGIDPEFLPRAFKAFEQGHKTHARSVGLGLGLAICKTIVDLHDGHITANSEGRGQGSTFVVSLPRLVGVLPENPRPSPSTTSLQSRGQSRLRILLVEDEEDTARAMRRLLSADGHTVEWADDISSALKLANEHPFDLILSDLGLPDGTGGSIG